MRYSVMISLCCFLMLGLQARAENACDLLASGASTVLIEGADLITKLFTTDRACTKEENITDLLTHEGSYSDPDYGKRLDQAIHNFETGKGKPGWIGAVLKDIKKLSPSEYQSLLSNIRSFGSKVKEMNPKELKLFKDNPFVAVWMDHNREKAESYCYGDEFKKEFKDLQASEVYLGRTDACRHMTWNAMASRFGMSSFIEKFATAHETGAADLNPGAKPGNPGTPPGLQNDPLEMAKMKMKEVEVEQELNHCPKDHSKKFVGLDHAMDIHNNKVGRKVGIDTCPHGYSTQVIEKGVVAAIKEGKAVVLNCRDVGKYIISKLEPSNQYMLKPTVKVKMKVPAGMGGPVGMGVGPGMGRAPGSVPPGTKENSKVGY
jgi:hypothetical protein